jgi:ankyrin repeat protein
MLAVFGVAGLVLLFLEGRKRAESPRLSRLQKLLAGVAAGMLLLIGGQVLLDKDGLMVFRGLLALLAAIGFTLFFSLTWRLQETPAGRQLYGRLALLTLVGSVLWMPMVYERLGLSLTCFLVIVPCLPWQQRRLPVPGSESGTMTEPESSLLKKMALAGSLVLMALLMGVCCWGWLKAVRTQRLLAVCSRGTPEQIQAALGLGTKVNVTNLDGQTPLLLAAEANPHPQAIMALIQAGAKVNARQDRNYCYVGIPLFAAICNPNPEILATLIRAGANIHQRDQNGQVPLTYAMEAAKNLETIRVLIQAGADVNVKDSDGMTPLMCASRYSRDLKRVKILLQADANVNLRNRLGMTALMYAVEYEGTPEIVQALLQAGAEVNAHDDAGISPLMATARYGYKSNLEIARLLLQAGAEVNARENEGWTTLMLAACYNRNPEMLKILLQAGAEINAQDINGETALTYAIGRKKLQMLDLLMRAGANIEIKNRQGMTPLLVELAGYANAKIVEALIRHGANVNAKDSHGQSVLEYARNRDPASQCPRVVEMLIQAGAK